MSGIENFSHFLTSEYDIKEEIEMKDESIKFLQEAFAANEYLVNKEKTCPQKQMMSYNNTMRDSRLLKETGERVYKEYPSSSSGVEITFEKKSYKTGAAEAGFQENHSNVMDSITEENGGVVVRNNDSKPRKTTHTSRLYKCPKCNYETNRKSDFNRHLLVHANCKSYKCSECGYESSRKIDLKKHLFVHNSNSKLFNCTECNYITDRKSDLTRHLLVHSNCKSFKCSECDYETSQKVDLKKHLYTHNSDTKLYRCPECQYETDRKRDLTRHLLVHSNCKSFKCSECAYETSQKIELKKHLFSHSTTSEMFKCSECQYETDRKRDLTRHLLVHASCK